MDFCIEPDELRKALSEIEIAEKNGFKFCLSVFKFSQAGLMLDQNRSVYSDIIEKAHPVDGSLDWGRFQNVTKNNKFVDGELIPIRGS